MLPDAFVCLDTETTGLKPIRDRVIEIGLIRFEYGEEVSRFHALLDPGVPLAPIITEITGITDADLIDKPKFADIADELARHLEGAVFVAHNAEFDYEFLKSEFARIGQELSLTRLCTVRLSRMLFPEHRRHDLSSIIERYEFPVENRHRAVGDAENVSRLLTHMTENIPENTLVRAIRMLQIAES